MNEYEKKCKAWDREITRLNRGFRRAKKSNIAKRENIIKAIADITVARQKFLRNIEMNFSTIHVKSEAASHAEGGRKLISSQSVNIEKRRGLRQKRCVQCTTPFASRDDSTICPTCIASQNYAPERSKKCIINA